MTRTSQKSIIFITGTFLGANCWDEWRVYFETNGYSCMAPAWPYKNAPPEELRNRHPDAAIALNRLVDLTDYYATIIHALPDKPILIGHSLGGLIVQLLLQRGIGTAGVAIHSFPPQGVSTFKFSFLKAAWKAMGLLSSRHESYMMSFRRWKYTIANGMTCEQQKESYYAFAIPESKLIMRDIFKCKATIDFKNPHAPLLFISGSLDQISPASLNLRNYQAYKIDNSITRHKEFEGRNHLIFDPSVGNSEAGFVLQWLQEIDLLTHPQPR